MAELRAFPLDVGNTCSGCGRPILVAYAANRDAAIAGKGLCRKCAEGTETAKVTVNDEVDATPQARKLADQYGIDLYDVAAGLPGDQRVGKADVRAYLDDLDEISE